MIGCTLLGNGVLVEGVIWVMNLGIYLKISEGGRKEERGGREVGKEGRDIEKYVDFFVYGSYFFF